MKDQDKTVPVPEQESLNRRDVLKRTALMGAGVAGGALALSSASQPASAMSALRKTQNVLGRGGDGDLAVWNKIPIPEQAPATEGYADTSPVKLWYWDTGGDGEAIVLCHPWSQSSLIWKYQQPVFAAAGYRTIAYSRRGAYKTPRSPEGDTTSTVHDVDELTRFLGVDKFHLVGCAAGGVTAMSYAIVHPEKLHSLVLSGTILLPNEDEWRTAFDGMRGSSAAVGSEPQSRQATTQFEIGPSYRFGNPEGVHAWAELEEFARPEGLYAGQPWGADVTWEAMEAMTVPTLLMTGEADGGAPPAMKRMFAQHIPNHELRIISEAGHASYWEQPEEFNQIVLDFIGRHASRG